MIRLALFSLLTLLTACSDSDTPPLPGSHAGEGRPSPIASSLSTPAQRCSSWGDLSCQKKANCFNPILNLEKGFLIVRFNFEFLKTNDAEGYEAIFECGRRVAKWGERLLPDYHELSDERALFLNEFMYQFIDGIQQHRCQSSGLTAVHLHDYFKQTQEYKNECIK